MSEKPEVELVGCDGNAFAILGRCRRASNEANWTKEQWEKFKFEAVSGDYDHLLRTVMTYFEVL